MDNSKVIAKELLGPAANDMNWAIVIKDLLHSAAIANPIKQYAPKILLVLGDTPTTASSFTNKGVEVALLFGALARIETHGAQTGAFEC
jgi:hypothetical protein